MHANARLITDFYAAFVRRDGAAMAACYHRDVRFSDPVFPDLRGERAGAMWKMLCQRATDLVVEARDITADDTRGAAAWDARYTFGDTGRRVHNRIAATFEFADGLIVRHRDDFDLYRWARQALGPAGVLLGWTPMVRGAVRRKAAAALDRYLATPADPSR
jgi:ketosteroid isomerase-like protein